MSLNIQRVSGNLTKAAQITKSEGVDKLSFTMADNNGDYTEFFPVVVWGKTGAFDNLAKHLQTGKYVEVTGKLVWLDAKEYNGVVANGVLVDCRGARSVSLGPDGKGAQGSKDKPDDQPSPLTDDQQQQADAAINQADNSAPGETDLYDDDIPF